MIFEHIKGHDRPIQWLQTAIQSQHFGHAYLFYGEPAIGKRQTAVALAQFLHCENPQPPPLFDSCGQCRSCHQIQEFIHPDLFLLQPADETKQNPKIKIDQIRDIEHLMTYRPLIGSHKICLIDDAESMTIEAANALLKTLEDPPNHCLFLLISSQPDHLLPTIRSRCLSLRFSPLPVDQVVTYLTEHTSLSRKEAQLVAVFSEGRLGYALTLDPAEITLKVRQYWALLFGTASSSAATICDLSEDLVKTHHVPEAMHWFWLALRDLLSYSLDPDQGPSFFQDQKGDFPSLCQHLSPGIILNLLQELHQLEQGQRRNLNVQIGLERFLFHVQDALTGTSSPESVPLPLF